MSSISRVPINLRARTTAEALASVLDEQLVTIHLPVRDPVKTSRVALVDERGHRFTPTGFGLDGLYAAFTVPHGRYRGVALMHETTTV